LTVRSAGVSLWPRYHLDEPPPDERERSVWTDIDLAFAEPVNRSDDVADYAPTQIIAELFKREQYDGIKYRSALSDTGHNVALFDITTAELHPTSCTLFAPTEINVKGLLRIEWVIFVIVRAIPVYDGDAIADW
jgi:hypothetical protein